MKKSRTVVVIDHSKPVSKTKDSTADPVFCAEYEKEAVKQDVLAAFAKADREAPKNIPFDHLQDAHMILMADKGYRVRYDRIGAAATENAFDDPKEKPDQVQVLESFRTAVAAGVIPDPNTLIFVANCFAMYLDRTGKPDTNGRVSLDLCFGMPSKQRVGNPAQQKAKQKDDEWYFFLMARHRREYPDSTIQKASEIAYAEINDEPRITQKQNDEALSTIERMAGYYSKEDWGWVEQMSSSTPTGRK